jgi:serine/threonine protein kinase
MTLLRRAIGKVETAEGEYVRKLFHDSLKHTRSRKDRLMERVQIALSIAEAIDYLQRNIVFRDLKPDNIGFDKDGAS